jgi:hypothetical protein
MKRRTFITLLGGAAAWPFAVRAQQPGGMRRVGILMPLAADDPYDQARLAAFLHEAMEAASGKTAKREARELLLERLRAGPVKQNDILEEAKQDGIAERTLRRAKKELGIKSWKERGRIDGDWFWELPPQGWSSTGGEDGHRTL